MGSQTVFQNFDFFIVEICILIWDFWVIFENISISILSIRSNNFIAHWTYEETIHHTLSIRRTNFRICSASGKMLTVFTCTIYAENMGKWFYRTLSIRGNDLSHPEHTRKWFQCLQVEYLGWIECDFQKSRVSCPCDHKDSVSAKMYFKKFHACVPFKSGSICCSTA